VTLSLSVTTETHPLAPLSDQEQGRAQSPAEEISQREDRRLGAMTAEDRAWETASLERHREQEERASRARATGGID
jgi:hypothetical protein